MLISQLETLIPSKIVKYSENIILVTEMFRLPPITTLLPSILENQILSLPISSEVVPEKMEAKKRNLPIIKNKFSKIEDDLLINLYDKLGPNWVEISRRMPNRSPRQCRERWNNYINPNLKIGPWTIEEDALLLEKYSVIGPHWSFLSKIIEGRSENAVRNRWVSLNRKKST